MIIKAWASDYCIYRNLFQGARKHFLAASLTAAGDHSGRSKERCEKLDFGKELTRSQKHGKLFGQQDRAFATIDNSISVTELVTSFKKLSLERLLKNKPKFFKSTFSK